MFSIMNFIKGCVKIMELIKRGKSKHIEFKYNEEKATQAALYLLEKSKGNMEYIRLIKLLYLADRKALLDSGRSITTDKFVSMKYGPVLSRVYANIRNSVSSYWSEHIAISNEADVKIIKKNKLLKLSGYEEKILDEIYEKFKNKKTWGKNGLIEYTHNLPEWDKKAEKENTSIPIELKTIFKEKIKNEEVLNSVIEEIKILSSSKY